jgi:hypothetical protein
MTTLRDHLAVYLRMRRELGYRLEKLELLAGQFCDWLDAEAKTTFTIVDAVSWARLPGRADPQWWAIRLGAGANLRHLPTRGRGRCADPTPRGPTGEARPILDALHLLPTGPEHAAGCLPAGVHP